MNMETQMKKTTFSIVVLVLSAFYLSACLVDGSWLNIVGRWRDIQNPIYEVEFTERGLFYEYISGQQVSNGEFTAEGKRITLHYLIPCGPEHQVDCYVELKFTVTEETLILTDSYGDVTLKKVGRP
jgi:hypothetical protein